MLKVRDLDTTVLQEEPELLISTVMKFSKLSETVSLTTKKEVSFTSEMKTKFYVHACMQLIIMQLFKMLK